MFGKTECEAGVMMKVLVLSGYWSHTEGLAPQERRGGGGSGGLPQTEVDHSALWEEQEEKEKVSEAKGSSC